MTCSKTNISIEDICKNKHDYNSKNDEICKNIIYTLLNLIKKTDDVKKLNTNLLKLTRNKNGMLRKTDIIHVYRKLIHSGVLEKMIFFGLFSKNAKQETFLV